MEAKQGGGDAVPAAGDESFADTDTDGDGRLSKAEYEELMARRGETGGPSFAELDEDGDGVLDPAEFMQDALRMPGLYRVVEGEMNFVSTKQIAEHIREAIWTNHDRSRGYGACVWFLITFVIFIALITTTLKTERNFDIRRAIAEAMGEETLLRMRDGDNPNNKKYITTNNSWLSDIIDPIFQDLPCGDGKCQPLEEASWRGYGCQADCGTYSNVTSVEVSLTWNFRDDADVASTTWSLCTVLTPKMSFGEGELDYCRDHFARPATYSATAAAVGHRMLACVFCFELRVPTLLTTTIAP